MESSPRINHGIDPRDAEVLADIDATLAGYDESRVADHTRAMEERNLSDLMIFVMAGEMTLEQAEARHYAWLHTRLTDPPEAS